MTTTAKLLIIDPQNDFCDIPAAQLAEGQAPALPVPGGHADMLRLAAFIAQAGARLDDIVVTLDSHPVVGIERTTFWRDAAGAEVAPFTAISAADVAQGAYVPAGGARIDPVSGKPLAERVAELLAALERAGRYTLMAWPVHCVTATWGANIHPAVATALGGWERASLQPVRKVLKGEYPLVEHYGVFEAEVPLAEVASTRFNLALAEGLRADTLIVAGEASSHCVSASVEQLIRHRGGDASGIVLLTDCMSPVGGFADQAAAFFARAQAAGARLMTSEQAAASFT